MAELSSWRTSCNVATTGCRSPSVRSLAGDRRSLVGGLRRSLNSTGGQRDTVETHAEVAQW